MTQNAMILQHLEAGNTITPAEAYSLFGTLALHSRISELRHQGYRIDGKIRTGHGKKWGEYWLSILHG